MVGVKTLHVSSEGGICGWDSPSLEPGLALARKLSVSHFELKRGVGFPSVTRNVSGRVGIGTRLVFQARELAEFPPSLETSGRRWCEPPSRHFVFRVREGSVVGGIPLRCSKREWEHWHWHENPPSRISSEGGVWNSPLSLEM